MLKTKHIDDAIAALSTTLTDDEAAGLEAPSPLVRTTRVSLIRPCCGSSDRVQNIRRLTLWKQSRPLASLHSDPSVWCHLPFKIVVQGISKSCPDISKSQAGQEQVNLTFERGAIIGNQSHAPNALPVLPLLSEGKGSELTFVKFDPRRPLTRLVLRLWRSPYRLATGSRADEQIRYGALYQEAFHQPWHLVTLGTTTSWPDAVVVPQLLPIGMHLLSRSTMQDGAVRRVVLVLLLTSGETPQ